MDFDPHKPVAVAYIGNKKVKRDTLCNTGIVWNGFGDVQAVPAPAAGVLLRHKDVWSKPGDVPKPAAPGAEEQKDKAPGLTLGDILDDGAEKASEEAGEPDPGDPESETVGAQANDIKSAILSLDRDNPEHFSSQGKPKVDAVRAAMGGEEISVKDVNEAWKALTDE